MKYKNILLDMGNVIIDFSPDYILSHYTKDGTLLNKLKHAIFLHPIWSISDGGSIGEGGIFEEAKKCLNPTLHDLAREIIETWYQHITYNETMFQILRRLKEQGFRLILCSNAAESFHRYANSIPAFAFLDAVVVSSDIAKLKPNRDFFEYVLKTYTLKAEECFFVDDLVANIKGAYECGIDGYWYNGNAILLERFFINMGMLKKDIVP